MTTTIHKQILINAFALLDSPSKWIKGCLGTKKQMCLEGSVFYATLAMGFDPYRDEVFVKARTVVQEVLIKRGGPGRAFGLGFFNDQPTTTFEDVKAVLKDAIANA